MSIELNKESVEQADASSCQGTNCGTTTGDHSSECLAEAAAGQGWELKPGDLCGRDCPIHKILAEQAGGDERGALQELIRVRDWVKNRRGQPEKLKNTGQTYIMIEKCETLDMLEWAIERARAALAQPSPASDLDPLNLAPHAEAFNEAPAEALKPEQAEAERPIVSFEKYMQVMYDRDENAKRLDAALARVAELELKLDQSDYAYDNDRHHMRGMAKQAAEAIQVFTGHDSGANLAHRYGEKWWEHLDELRDALLAFAKNAPPAQAQHSVPVVTPEMVMAAMAVFRLDVSPFKSMEAALIAALRKAAAPGKEGV